MRRSYPFTRATRAAPARLAPALLVMLAACTAGEAPRAVATDEGGAHDVVRVAAAASMRDALEEIVTIFADRHGDRGWRVQRVYTASGAAYQQLLSGAPFHLFISADALHPRALEERALAEPDSRRVYACGALALWRTRESPDAADDVPDAGGRMTIPALADVDVRRVAIANPETAPYGRAAIEVLRAAGVEVAVRPKLVIGQDASQAAQIALAGADAAILPRSTMLAPALTARGQWSLIDPRSHAPLAHSLVLIRRGNTPPPAPARALHALLLSGAAAGPLRRHGYALPRRDDELPRANDDRACDGVFLADGEADEPRGGAR